MSPMVGFFFLLLWYSPASLAIRSLPTNLIKINGGMVPSLVPHKYDEKKFAVHSFFGPKKADGDDHIAEHWAHSHEQDDVAGFEDPLRNGDALDKINTYENGVSTRRLTSEAKPNAAIWSSPTNLNKINGGMLPSLVLHNYYEKKSTVNSFFGPKRADRDGHLAEHWAHGHEQDDVAGFEGRWRNGDVLDKINSHESGVSTRRFTTEARPSVAIRSSPANLKKMNGGMVPSLVPDKYDEKKSTVHSFFGPKRADGDDHLAEHWAHGHEQDDVVGFEDRWRNGDVLDEINSHKSEGSKRRFTAEAKPRASPRNGVGDIVT